MWDRLHALRSRACESFRLLDRGAPSVGTARRALLVGGLVLLLLAALPRDARQVRDELRRLGLGWRDGIQAR